MADRKQVLVPVDNSPQATEARTYAFENFSNADLIFLHVIDPIEAGYSAPVSIPGHSEEWYEAAKEDAESLFDEVEEQANEIGVAVTTETEIGRPARIIVEYATDKDIDQIVMGSHGRSGVSRILLGSVAETVVRRSPVPVTVVR